VLRRLSTSCGAVASWDDFGSVTSLTTLRDIIAAQQAQHHTQVLAAIAIRLPADGHDSLRAGADARPDRGPLVNTRSPGHLAEC
jgi:anti-sigma factor RsiW